MQTILPGVCGNLMLLHPDWYSAVPEITWEFNCNCLEVSKIQIQTRDLDVMPNNWVLCDIS
jgi:hypothetical protein